MILIASPMCIMTVIYVCSPVNHAVMLMLSHRLILCGAGEVNRYVVGAFFFFFRMSKHRGGKKRNRVGPRANQ